MDYPRTFADALGREWTVEITLANARRMRDAAGISIEQLAPDMSGSAKSQQEAIEPVAAFLGDPFQAFEAFYALVKPAADARSMSKDQVLEGFSDEASVERMVSALLGAVCLFFQRSPKRLAMARMLMVHFEKWLKKVNGKIESAVSKLDFGKALDGLPEIDADAINAQLAGQLKSFVIDSPAPSEASTPKPTP